MGQIDYKAIYEQNQDEWKALTRDPQRYEALLAGHYSDSNHFVYELLQNAEDAFDKDTGASASIVVIEYYADKLVFYHNGKPFDEADVRGVSSMLMGTKDRDDAQTIGRFGMGFKSVFKYTYQPEIYSDDEAFKITNYLLPVEISDGWDYEAEKKSISCKLGEGRAFLPFLNEKHLTKIVIPFMKYGRKGELEPVPGDDVLKKLDELNGEILLFLSHIKNLYWINKENGKYAHITLQSDEKDERIITCRIEGTEYGDKEEISRYLKFKKVFDHPEMDNAEVSVAYKLNSRADNINDLDKSYVWVYFPTKDETKLPFLIHGSFETAVSREKLMAPSSFNAALFDELGNLIADSMKELAKRKLITQVFLRRIVLEAFEDEEENDTIPGLKEKVTKVIREYGLLPDRKGEYRKPEEMYLPIPFKMADFADRPLLGKVFKDKVFVAFNNEKEANYTEYFNWLTEEMDVQLYQLSSLAEDLAILKGERVPTSGEKYKEIKEFYDFLSDNRESVYSTGLSYSRGGPVDRTIRQNIGKAWELLRNAPIILNRHNDLVPAEVDGKQYLYLGSSSEYKKLVQSVLVNKDIASTFSQVLQEGFHIHEFNNYQYVKEKVIQKYIDIEDKLGFADRENYKDEYIEDLNQIFALIKETGDVSEIRNMLKDAYIIKIKPDSEADNGTFNFPGYCHVPVSDEGIDLNTYYAPVPYEGMDEEDLKDPDNGYGFELDPIDVEFYEENGIAISSLAKLGVVTSPVTDGARRGDGVGDGYWFALGEYCPNIRIDGLEDNIDYISNYSDHELAKEKSVEVLKLLTSIAGKLKGKKRKRKLNPYESETEEVVFLKYVKTHDWLFDRDMNAAAPRELSRFDLNVALYGDINANKTVYDILGFIEKEADEAEDTLQKAANLNRQDKKRLIKWLAKDLGLTVTEDDNNQDDWETESNSEVFDPTSWQDDAFPINRVRNMEYLVRHVQEQFYCADPTTYKKVLRQIRVSKNSKADRAYAIGMYTNASNVTICQMCRKPVAFTEVSQIANFGIEMPQLNLCLCRECAARYSQIRDVNKDEFKKKIRDAILTLDVEGYSDEYTIDFNSETALCFTQTHIAEIQEIFRLLAEYGTPSEKAVDYITDEALSGPLMHPNIGHTDRGKIERGTVSDAGVKSTDGVSDVAVAGQFISYKKKFDDYGIYDNILDPKKYDLHKALEGHRVGDVITFKGKSYEIIGV